MTVFTSSCYCEDELGCLAKGVYSMACSYRWDYFVSALEGRWALRTGRNWPLPDGREQRGGWKSQERCLGSPLWGVQAHSGKQPSYAKKTPQDASRGPPLSQTLPPALDPPSQNSPLRQASQRGPRGRQGPGYSAAPRSLSRRVGVRVRVRLRLPRARLHSCRGDCLGWGPGSLCPVLQPFPREPVSLSPSRLCPCWLPEGCPVWAGSAPT